MQLLLTAYGFLPLLTTSSHFLQLFPTSLPHQMLLKPALFFGLLLGIAALVAMFRERTKTQSLSSYSDKLTIGLTWAVRLFVGILFTFSGWIKANDYIGFAYKLEEYFEVFTEYTPFLKTFWLFWAHNAEPLAWFISIFEIALAFAIMVGWRMRLTMWLTLLMMVFFTFLTGFSAITNTVTDCGCFGDAIKLKPIESFFKDLILLVVIAPVFVVRAKIAPILNNRWLAAGITALSFVVSGWYAWYCHENLPVVDYLPYKVGTNLNICTTEIVDGAIKCKDWDEVYRLGAEYDALQGKVLAVVMYDMKLAPEVAVRKTAVLANELAAQDTSIRVLGMTSTGRSDMLGDNGYIKRYNLPYAVSLRDRTMLKSIMRSNPGLMLLNNGVVVAKWHYNNMPTAAEVRAALK